MADSDWLKAFGSITTLQHIMPSGLCVSTGISFQAYKKPDVASVSLADL